MMNQDAVQAVLSQARDVEKARAEFIRESDFYKIRDSLFSMIMLPEAQDEDAAIAIDAASAAQVVEYIERTEELIPALAQLIYAIAYGTAPAHWVHRPSKAAS
jgi:hypothetical protein